MDKCKNTSVVLSDAVWHREKCRVDSLLNVTINDISITCTCYVTAHICAGGLKKTLGLRSGSQRHRHFVGFFNLPVQASTRGHPFYGYSEKPPLFSRLLRCTWEYGGPILVLNPEVLRGRFGIEIG